MKRSIFIALILLPGLTFAQTATLDRSSGMPQFITGSTDPELFPQPVEDDAVLNFDLALEQNITCLLFDAQGRFIRPLFTDRSCSAGGQYHACNLSDVRAGEYTIWLSNGSEQVSVDVIKL